MDCNYTFKVLNVAKRDIKEIMDYIVYDLSNAIAADKLYDKILDGFKRITSHPFSCPKFFDTKHRKLIIDNYIVFYSVDEERKFVIVHRVKYGGRNLLDYI